MKKGFTLVELLGVMVILGILALVVFPPTLNQIRNTKKNISDSEMLIVESSTDLYLAQHGNDYNLELNDIYYVLIGDLVKDGVLDESFTENISKINDLEIVENYMKITILENNQREYEVVGAYGE
jgi:prepilin-type N-terminal cleavage/methylation domain-containing protein